MSREDVIAVAVRLFAIFLLVTIVLILSVAYLTLLERKIIG